MPCGSRIEEQQVREEAERTVAVVVGQDRVIRRGRCGGDERHHGEAGDRAHDGSPRGQPSVDGATHRFQRGHRVLEDTPVVLGLSAAEAPSAASISRAAASDGGGVACPAPRPMRSAGPETETTATRPPCRSKTGALTDATPRPRSPTLSAHPRGATNGRALRPRPPSCPREEDLAGGTLRQRERGAHRNDRAQLARGLHGIDADAAIAVADVELRALAGRRAQALERRAREARAAEGRASRSRRGRAAWAQPVPASARRALRRPWSSIALMSRWAVGRVNPVASTICREGAGAELDGVEDRHRAIQDADRAGGLPGRSELC